ncbi:hypothetical protein GCM10011320_42280 [Neoroseomonas lacus]|uniref:Uncharacterized protein n=1 Tax=Neoroseomonas lacus TaxID=287609 RepID=A0A917KWM0_9PROT|nr:hypothetical protein GCM10011320_42280 [Neoroseomonas lacus]
MHDGGRLAHQPLRLARGPAGAIGAVLDRHRGVGALFVQRWLHLLALEHGGAVRRFRDHGQWLRDDLGQAGADPCPRKVATA